MIPALSLRQPWGALVVHFGKPIENRRWNTSFRGSFLIHAAKGMTRLEFDEALEFARAALGDKCPSEAELRATLQFGGIIGRARLVEVVPPQTNLSLVDDYPPGIDRRWHMPSQYGFVLADVEPIVFRPWRGQLGFFDVDMEVA
jgi:hypothetical protein